MSLVHEFVLLLLFSNFMPLLLAAGDQGRCPPSFHCGYLGNITFPFTVIGRQDCGFLSIRNCNDHDPHTPKFIQVQANGNWDQVVAIYPLFSIPTTHFATFQFRDKHFYDLLQNRNCEAFTNSYTLPLISHFATFRLAHNATLFLCNKTLNVTNINTSKYNGCLGYDLYYNHFTTDDDASRSSFTACKKVVLPIKDVPDANDPFTFVTGDVNVIVALTDQCSDCHYRKGQCQLDSREQFCCANGTLQQKPWKHKHP